MESFFYKAKEKEGRTITGEIEAGSEKEVADLLRGHNLYVVDIIPNKKRLARLFDLSSIKFGRSVSDGDIAYFTRQFASMIVVGITVTEALAILSKETKNKGLSELLKSLLASIEGGSSLSLALSWHSRVFSPVYISLVKAAEAAGLLDKVLLRLADNLEQDREFKAKVKGALVYPVIVIIGIIGVMTVMMVFVVPKLSELYASLNIDLPLTTRIVIAISTFMAEFWFLIIVFLILGFFAFQAWIKTDFGRRQIDRLALKLPIFGDLREKLILTEVTRTLGLLVGAGTPILESVNIASHTAGNVWYQDSLGAVAAKIEKGMPIAASMGQDTRFPLILTQMVRVGEETGKVGDALLRVSQYFESESTRKIATLTTLLEPLIIVILGVGVGFLIISVITPIYNLTSAIQ